jgi:hypothetical protein
MVLADDIGTDTSFAVCTTERWCSLIASRSLDRVSNDIFLWGGIVMLVVQKAELGDQPDRFDRHK